MYADIVWNRNFGRIQSIIGGIVYGYRLEGDTFKREAQNKFYENFAKYYEDDGSYLSFFYASLSNLAKNKVKSKARDMKHTSMVMDEEGEETSIFDIISIEDNSMHDELFMNEINELMKNTLDEQEYFVYEHLVEGWSAKDIGLMLNEKPARVWEMRNNIGTTLKGYL